MISLNMAGHDWTSWLYWIGGGLIALLGLFMLIWALWWDRARGRKRCPKCWYDLAGIAADDAGASPLTCSECGKRITKLRKLSKTRRRWRWAFIALLLILVPAGVVGWRETRSFNWNTVKPVWLLKREGTIDSPGGEAARKELVRRMQQDLLKSEQIHDLAEFVLAIQADPNAFWQGRSISIDSTWGDLFEEAWDRGHLTDQQISQYLETAFGASFAVTPRAQIRAGAMVPVQFRNSQPRLSMRWNVFQPGADALVAMSKLVETPKQLRSDFPERLRSIGGSRTAGTTSSQLWHCNLPPGQHVLSFKMDFVVVPQKQGEPFDGSKEGVSEFENALATWHKQFDVIVEVVDGDSIQRVPDPSLNGAIHDAIAITIGAQQLEKGRTSYGGKHGIVLVDPLPVAISFDVIGRVGENEHYLGSFASAANRSRIDNISFDALKNDPRSLFPNHDKIDLVLRTNPEPAERTVEIESVWEGEITIKDVSLERINK